VLSGSLARVDYSGNITSYIDNTGNGLYNGVTSYSGSYLIDSSSPNLAGTSSNIGFYKVDTSNFSSIQTDPYNFGSSTSKMLVINDYTTNGQTIDAYLARSSYINATTNERIIWGVTLIDTLAQQFSSNAWVSEPVIANFSVANFFVRSMDLTTNAMNYSLRGNVTYLKDPVCGSTSCGNAGNLTLTRVPEPSVLLMFSIGLAGLFFRKKKVIK